MDLNETAMFVKVVQLGSFSAAARQLQLPTSTVSTRVARLEQRLGTTLLQRTTRRLHLTEAGKTYFEHAVLGLSHLHEAEAAVSAAKALPQGQLKITAPADLGDGLLGELVQQVQAVYPALALELLLTDRYVDLIADGVDVAIRTGELRDSSLIAKTLGAIQWASFASTDYLAQSPALQAPQDLTQHRCIQFTPMGRDSWTLQQASGSMTIPLPGTTLINSIGVVHAMASNGQGVALLPTYICKTAVANGRLQRVLPGWQGRKDPLHLVYPQQRYMPPKLRAFLDLAQPILTASFQDAHSV